MDSSAVRQQLTFKGQDAKDHRHLAEVVYIFGRVHFGTARKDNWSWIG